MASADAVRLPTGTPALEVIVPVSPVPAARPKVYRHGTTYPKRYQTYRVEAHTWAEAQTWNTLVGPLVVFVSFAMAKPRTSKLSRPIGDIDNYTKAILDVLNGRAWTDDVEIVDLVAKKRFALPGTTPHALVMAWRKEDLND